MFELALIRPHGNGPDLIDAGTLAETLLFYKKIHVAADRSLLTSLLQTINPQDFLNLIKDNRVSVSYSKSTHGVAATAYPHLTLYDFVSMSLAKTADGKRITKHDEVRGAVSSAIGFGGKSRKIADRLIEAFHFANREFPIAESVHIAHEELDDRDHLITAVRLLLGTLVPGYTVPAGAYFYPVYLDGRFTIETNLDLHSINAERRKFSPGDDITIALLLDWIRAARMDATMAADYMAELITKDESSSLIRLKLLHLMRKRDKSIEQIDLFQETTLNQCRSIREAINSGERSFADFLPVLDKATKFKGWLDRQNPDANLLTEYYDSVVSDGPMSALPAKVLRYITTTAIGLAAPAQPLIGIVAAGVDTFLIDKLAKGWRPNHFVEGPLKKFVDV